jgi:hypothetical protein
MTDSPEGASKGGDRPIDFDRADFADAPSASVGGGVECSLCKRPITTEYWQYLGKILCESCRGVVARSIDEAQGGESLGKAVLLATAVALGTGLGYALFVELTHIQFALVTIGIGWAIGRTIQRVTRGFGSVKHQIVAVALTYVASAMGYLPAILGGIANAHTADLSLVRTAATAIAIMLAAPFIEMKGGLGGILGLLIMFFGMQTAWRVSKGVGGNLTGPHRIAPAAT